MVRSSAFADPAGENGMRGTGWLLAGLLAMTGVAGAQAAPNAADVQRLRDRLDDWAQMSRYRAENKLDGPPKAGQQRVVFLGDSLTDGWHTRMAFDFPALPYLNRGISGQTTGQMLVRFQQDVVQLQPAVVVILGGTSDISGNAGPSTLEMIEDNFRSMVAIAKAAHIRVILCSDLPVDFIPWASNLKPAEEIKALNGWIREFARSEGVSFLDYYPALVNEKGGMRAVLSSDGVHPNASGYAVMAPLAAGAIRTSLHGPRP